MMISLRAFLKQRTTIIGVAAAFLFQIIFSVVWMTGYDGVSENIGNFQLAIVNEDGQMGKEVAANLQQSLPFGLQVADSKAQAVEWLEQRKVQLIVHMPAQFTERLQGPDSVALQYMINESNPMMVKSVMESVAAEITKSINKQAIQMGMQATLHSLELPQEQVIMLSNGLAERVTMEMTSIHPVSQLSHQMIPLMLVIASYVGAMVMGMNIQQSAVSLRGSVSRWQRYGAWGILNLIAGVLVSLVGTSLMIGLGGQVEQGFLAMWGFQSLFLTAFLFVAQLFILWFGMAGMLFNIMLLSLQLVTSGAMIPRELLSDAFFKLSQYLPATYAVEGNMNLLYGGGGQLEVTLWLGGFIFVSILLGVIVTALRKDKNQDVQLHSAA